MKYLKKIYEGWSLRYVDKPIPEEIINTFIGIIDVFGEPNVVCKEIIDDTKKYFQYSLVWQTDLAWTIKDVDVLQKTMSDINKILHDLSSAKGRLSKNYVCNFEFTRGEIKITCDTKPVTN